MFALICYLSPYLGLFDTMLPYSVDSCFTYNNTTQFGAGPELLTAMKSQTWYPGLSFTVAAKILFIYPLLHTGLVLLMRGGWRDYSRPQHAYRRLLYALTGLLVPQVRRDWDQDWGQVDQDWGQVDQEQDQVREEEMYGSQWKEVRTEYRDLTILFCFENCLFCLPLLHTAGRTLQRHSLLSTIPLGGTHNHRLTNHQLLS